VIVPFLVAGAIAMLAAGIHGGVGESIVLRPLFSGDLPSSRFGGPSATRAMIRATWHIVTLTFLAFGSGLVTCGLVGPSDACTGIGVVAASSFTAFVVLTFWLALRRPGSFFFHPGPLAFLAVAGLAWWGTLAS
jgi:hypothetical protein